MAENILVIGGGCMMQGFMARLKEELLNAFDDDRRPEMRPLQAIKFYKPSVLPNYLAWAGGSIFGGLEVLAYRSVSREEYNLNHQIPDWTDRITLEKG
ncbi:unnamed protein product [Soboliphyme baturini]|uniref:Actin-related protein 8 n=1 Tax=Soboliphyme baturini TaxID=241478 RepID=A0A183I9G0_9BILA|nr:unnamed protein product [Soboliphyme baturini]